MAIYRMSAKVVSRSRGQSAVACAAYRAGQRLDDARTGQVHNYTRRRDILHAEIIAPDNAPDWMRDRAQLWNAVEKAEKRKDAQLAREIQLALPHELTHAQRVELARSFVLEEFVKKGMVADLALHAPDRQGDDRNHHAHVMLTMRELTGDGFGKKAREWNDKDQLQGWREHWAEHVNRGLETYGHEMRIDHRSYTDQGIEKEPEPKVGPIATEMERRGVRTDRGDERRAAKAGMSAPSPVKAVGIAANAAGKALEGVTSFLAGNAPPSSEAKRKDRDDMAQQPTQADQAARQQQANQVRQAEQNRVVGVVDRSENAKRAEADRWLAERAAERERERKGERER